MCARKLRKVGWYSKIWWVPTALLMVLAVAVVVRNLFGSQYPEWVTLVAFAGILVSCLVMWGRRDGSLRARIILGVCALFVGAICAGAAFLNPYWNSIVLGMNKVTRPITTQISSKAARQDLDAMIHYVRKVHPAFSNGLSEEVLARYKQAKAELAGMDAISIVDEARMLQSVIAPLGDAHTSLSLTFSDDEEPHTLQTASQHDKNGDVLLAINGTDLADLLDETRDLIISESDGYGINRIAELALTAEGLAYLGIPVEEGVEYTWLRTDGVEWTEQTSQEDYLAPDLYLEAAGPSADPMRNFVHWTLDPEHSLAILTLNACVNNKEYQESLRDLFTAMKQQGIENLAVDLRENGGGDSSVAEEFLKYLNVPSYRVWGANTRLGPLELEQKRSTEENSKYQDLLFGGNLYVLTSPDTFSSAMMFTELIKDNQLGTVIGEPPGNDPNGYGDLAIFELPNSHLLLNVSTKQWERIDSAAQGLIEPDIPAPASGALDTLYEELG